MATKTKPVDQGDDAIISRIKAIPPDPAIRAYQILSKLDLPLPRGALKIVVEETGLERWRADQAAALRVAFEHNPKARTKLEPLVLSGAITVRTALTRAKAQGRREPAARGHVRPEIARLVEPMPNAAATPSEDKPKKRRTSH